MFGCLTINYGWELCCFRKIRQFSDGISFLTWTIEWDKYEGDHKPAFRYYLGLLNYTILEFSIYNVNHTDENSGV